MNKLSITSNLLASWANDPKGPVALHLKQRLISVEGHGAVIFPATYPDIEYNIDELADGTKVATIDSVGSQANRMEPIFKSKQFRDLVPQHVFTYGDGRQVSIFDLGHRLADVLLRCTDLETKVSQAFKKFVNENDSTLIAKLAPTSLVFGVWDSRATYAKLPRIVQSVVRAWDVTKLHRSAVYNPAINFVEEVDFTEEQKKKSAESDSSPLAEKGFVNALSIRKHGGVAVKGEIVRDITINLVALRRLQGEDSDKLRSYIFGISLLAAIEPIDSFFRQGCLLTLDPGIQEDWVTVNRDGTRNCVDLAYDIVLGFATKAASDFGIESAATNAFIPERAKLIADASKDSKKAAEKAEIAAKKAAGKAELAAQKAAEKAAKMAQKNDVAKATRLGD